MTRSGLTGQAREGPWTNGMDAEGGGGGWKERELEAATHSSEGREDWQPKES